MLQGLAFNAMFTLQDSKIIAIWNMKTSESDLKSNSRMLGKILKSFEHYSFINCLEMRNTLLWNGVIQMHTLYILAVLGQKSWRSFYSKK